jgi:hypothetical protein
MIGSAFAFMSVTGGFAFLGVFVYIVFLAGYLFQRLTKDKKDVPPWWFTVNRIFTILIILAGFLSQLFSSTGTGFVGISYSMGIGVIFLWGFGIFTLAKDLNERAARPVYISPNVIPTFKYDSDTNKLKSYSQPFLVIAAGFVLLIVWALFANTQVSPNWFGAFAIMNIFFVGHIIAIALKATPLEQFKNDFERE